MSSYAAEGAQPTAVPEAGEASGTGRPETAEAGTAGTDAEVDNEFDQAGAGGPGPEGNRPDGDAGDSDADIGDAGDNASGDGDAGEYLDDGYADDGYAGDEYADDDALGERPKVSKLAVTALVTGILPLVPVALITGIAALIGIRRSGRRGRDMAVTAIFFAIGWLIIGVAVGTVAYLTHGFVTPTRTVYHQSAIFRLKTGDCVDGQDDVVACSTPHDAEVFGTFTLPGTSWPGSASVLQQAGSRCGGLLTGYLNPQLAISLAQTYVYPSQVDWKAGTRTVICEVHASSGQLTQSVRGGS